MNKLSAKQVTIYSLQLTTTAIVNYQLSAVNYFAEKNLQYFKL